MPGASPPAKGGPKQTVLETAGQTGKTRHKSASNAQGGARFGHPLESHELGNESLSRLRQLKPPCRTQPMGSRFATPSMHPGYRGSHFTTPLDAPRLRAGRFTSPLIAHADCCGWPSCVRPSPSGGMRPSNSGVGCHARPQRYRRARNARIFLRGFSRQFWRS